MTKIESQCELCKLPVKVEGFALAAPQGLLNFCCQGCLSVYRLLQADLGENGIDKE